MAAEDYRRRYQNEVGIEDPSSAAGDYVMFSMNKGQTWTKPVRIAEPLTVGYTQLAATGTWGELTFLSDNTNLSIDPGYKSPYTDQFIASLERDIGHGLGATLNYVHKRGKDYAAWQETAGTYVQVPFTDALEGDPTATGRTFDVFQLTSDPALRQFQITNPPGVGSNVNAVSLDLVKRMTDKWQVNASATWLRSTGRLTDSVSGVTLQQRGGVRSAASARICDFGTRTAG